MMEILIHISQIVIPRGLLTAGLWFLLVNNDGQNRFDSNLNVQNAGIYLIIYLIIYI